MTATKTKRSRTPGAVERAWKVFNGMPTAKRKEVLAECARLGINLNTSKTQYQYWRQQKSRPQKPEADTSQASPAPGS